MAERRFRIKPSDGLPKLLPWADWLRLVFIEKPDRVVVAGICGFDRGNAAGREPHLLLWVGGEVRAYALSGEVDALTGSLSLADRDRVASWRRAAERGEFAPALARPA